jgi:Prp8 binding protein
VLEVSWSSDNTKITSCSADKNLAIWDAEYFKLIRKLKGHTAIVNSCNAASKGF